MEGAQGYEGDRGYMYREGILPASSTSSSSPAAPLETTAMTMGQASEAPAPELLCRVQG